MKPISFPFDFNHKLIVLSVVINGKKTLRVVLDTGMPGDGLLLFKTRKTEELDLSFSNRLIAGGDSLKTVPVQLADDVVIDFPGLRLPKQSILVVDGNPFPVQTDIDGIVGYALLHRFAVKLDFDKCLMRCWLSKEYKCENQFVELPLVFREGFPYFPCSVSTSNGDQLSIFAYLDLGAASTIALNSDTHDEFKFTDEAIESKISSALGGTVFGRVNRIETLDIAGFPLKNVIATSCGGELARCIGQDGVHEASIGTDVLRRFKVVIDYSNKRLFLTPGSSFHEPFRFSMSGLTVRKMKLGHFLIEHVTPNSPGSESGLQKGDIIVRVNGIQANKVTIEEMNQILGKEDSLVVIISRKHTLMKFIINPRAML
ncbi:PDZ domain-containing protein [bacterium]|nr:PDZ domain-containing protein [bacterium]MBU1637252.1 PDZ domain-containing protein [bacterium]MBU1920269.1 PDZ domain-containing protein [bacterium]